VMGVVSEHLVSLNAKQVEERSLVVWYDPGADYRAVAETMTVPDARVARYVGSFLKLRRDIDRLLNGLEPPRLVVYVPADQYQTHHALVELEEAGVVMQPGQQPPNRNTRLSIVARNALKKSLGDERAAEIERQVEAGKLTLADLDKIGSNEKEAGGISIIFGTGNPQDVALGFLAGNRLDGEIEKKSATPELRELVHLHFDLAVPGTATLPEIQERLARDVLLPDLASGLGDKLPPSLASVKVADAPDVLDSCIRLARSWRLRRDGRESYVAASQKVEQDFFLSPIAFDVEKI